MSAALTLAPFPKGAYANAALECNNPTVTDTPPTIIAPPVEPAQAIVLFQHQFAVQVLLAQGGQDGGEVIRLVRLGHHDSGGRWIEKKVYQIL